MRIYSMSELFRMTRAELFQLYARTAIELPQLPEGSYDRYVALTNLRGVRHALTRSTLRPG